MHYSAQASRNPVRCPDVRSVRYDEANWVLQVEFAGGRVRNYLRVPPEEFRNLSGAASAGAFLVREIDPYYECAQAEAALG